MTPVAAPLAELLPALLKRVSDAEVRRVNTLLGLHRELGFTWAGKPARFRFVAADRPAAPIGFLRLRVGEHAFDLGLPALPDPASLGATFAGIELADLPGEALLGLLDVWLDEPLQALRRLGIGCELDSWRTAEEPPAPFCCWEIAWSGRDRFLTGTLHASDAALSQLADWVARAVPSPRTTAESVVTALRVGVAHVSLPATELATLAAGDVVLLPVTPEAWQKGECEIWAGSRLFARGVRQERAVKLLSMNAYSDTPMTAPTARTPIDQLPVQLVFEVGQIDLPLSQLRAVGAGYTFELPSMPEHTVTVRANGREIGQGELLDVGGKLGVRIVNWTLA